MSAFPRTPHVLGFAALLTAGTSAFAIDAAQAPQVAAAQVVAATPQAAEAAPSAAAEPVAPHTQQAVALVSNGVAARPAGDPNCPSVTLAPEGDTRRVDGTTATLDGLARDCANLGAETIVKVALVGESERKKEGAAAAIEAPMTIQIKDGQGRDVETRRINLKVEMPEGVQRVAFRHVEENVSLPPPSADGYANWTIVVGLDPTAEAEDVASADEGVEQPARSVRSSKSRKSRYARSRAAKRARDVAARQAPAPEPNPVVLSAKSQGGAQVTTTVTNSGSAMNKVAETARAARDKATYDRQVQALQADRARRGLPPVPASAIRRQGQPAQQQAARQPQTTTSQVRTAQTN